MQVFPYAIVFTHKPHFNAVYSFNSKVRLGGKDNSIKENLLFNCLVLNHYGLVKLKLLF